MFCITYFCKKLKQFIFIKKRAKVEPFTMDECVGFTEMKEFSIYDEYDYCLENGELPNPEEMIIYLRKLDTLEENIVV